MHAWYALNCIITLTRSEIDTLNGAYMVHIMRESYHVKLHYNMNMYPRLSTSYVLAQLIVVRPSCDTDMNTVVSSEEEGHVLQTYLQLLSVMDNFCQMF